MVIAVLMAIRVVPSFGLLGAELRRADIVSDVVTRDTLNATEVEPESLLASAEPSHEPSPKVSVKVPERAADTLPTERKSVVRDTLISSVSSEGAADTAATARVRDGIVPIEDRLWMPSVRLCRNATAGWCV